MFGVVEYLIGKKARVKDIIISKVSIISIFLSCMIITLSVFVIIYNTKDKVNIDMILSKNDVFMLIIFLSMSVLVLRGNKKWN